MSLAFNLTRYALLTLVAVSLGAWGARTWKSSHDATGGDALPADGLVVINFHSAIRCNGCREIDNETQTLVESDFAAELKSGRVSRPVINFEEGANKHFIPDYGLTTSTVVVTRREGGRDVEWQRLDGVWEHLFDGPAMRAYLKEHITQVMAPRPTSRTSPASFNEVHALVGENQLVLINETSG